MEQLPYIVKEQLENFHFNEKELLAYIQAIHEDAAHLDLPYVWEREYDEKKKGELLESLADILYKKINTYVS